MRNFNQPSAPINKSHARWMENPQCGGSIKLKWQVQVGRGGGQEANWHSNKRGNAKRWVSLVCVWAFVGVSRTYLSVCRALLRPAKHFTTLHYSTLQNTVTNLHYNKTHFRTLEYILLDV